MRMHAVIIAVLLLAAGAGRTHGQDAALDRVQNLINTGRFTEASNTLGQWERAHGDPRSDASTADRARALYLRGVLSSDAKEAEDAFVGVVLSYPSSPSAPAALLRLGQGLLAGGDARRAVAYLERLRNDYPGAREREAGMLWLARAQLASGSAAAACATARDGYENAATANVRTLLELERDNACSAAPAAPAGYVAPPQQRIGGNVQPGAQQPATQQPAAPQAGTQQPAAQQPQPAAAANAGRAASTSTSPADNAGFAVQAGAFRERSSAVTVAAELRARGFDTRIVTVEGSPLHRVRFGRFATSADAAAAARRLRDAGFTAIVVTDARLER
jgi:cell division septation protein DedD